MHSGNHITFTPNTNDMKKLFALALIFSLISCAGFDLSSLGGGPVTEGEARNGIKEALVRGIGQSVVRASATDGYFGNALIRIPVPPEARVVVDALQTIGLGAEVDRAVLAMNRAAEEAAKEAGPIFRQAIQNLTIAEAFNIVRGEQDAATRFLQVQTQDQLVLAFSPIIDKHMQATGATKLWEDIFTQYNRLPLVRRIDPNLGNYVTNQAIQGLFTLVAEEEQKIRTDPAARTTVLLRRVFSGNV
jgi:hypothetical protein